MTDREVLIRRFNALMASIKTSRLYQTAPNVSADAIRRLQARIEQDVDEGMKLFRKVAFKN